MEWYTMGHVAAQLYHYYYYRQQLNKGIPPRMDQNVINIIEIQSKNRKSNVTLNTIII